MNDWVDIEVLNWEKYNPKRLKTMPWVRMDSNIFFSPTFSDLDLGERIVFFFLITYSGFRNSSLFSVKLDYFERHSGVKKEVILSALGKLEQVQVIASSRTHRVLDESLPSPIRDGRNERTNVTNVTNERTSTTNSQKKESGEKVGAPVDAVNWPEAKLRCECAWLDTLKFFKIERNLLPSEPLLIARAIQRWGPEAVELALIGVRYEPASEGYDPAKNVFLNRVLPPDPRDEGKFQRLYNLGIQAMTKKTKQSQPKSSEPEEKWPEADPDRVREILKGAGF